MLIVGLCNIYKYVPSSLPVDIPAIVKDKTGSRRSEIESPERTHIHVNMQNHIVNHTFCNHFLNNEPGKVANYSNCYNRSILPYHGGFLALLSIAAAWFSPASEASPAALPELGCFFHVVTGAFWGSCKPINELVTSPKTKTCCCQAQPVGRPCHHPPWPPDLLLSCSDEIHDVHGGLEQLLLQHLPHLPREPGLQRGLQPLRLEELGRLAFQGAATGEVEGLVAVLA